MIMAIVKKKIETPKVVKAPIALAPVNQHPDYPDFISLPYPLAHKASRTDRRIRVLLQTQVAEHKAGLKKNK